MNDAINLSSNAAETSFVNEEEESQNYSTDDNDESDKLDEEDPLSKLPNKKKVVISANKKSNVIRPNKQAINEIAQSLKIYPKAQSKHHQKDFEEYKKREDRILQVKREEVQNDRLH